VAQTTVNGLSVCYRVVPYMNMFIAILFNAPMHLARSVWLGTLLDVGQDSCFPPSFAEFLISLFGPWPVRPD